MPAVPRVGGLLLSRPERAREAARHVLSLPAHRNSLPMLGALAALEEAAGLPRAARKILDTALAAAVALPPTARTTLPLLVQQYAEAEWRRASAAAMAAAAGGGGGGTVTVAAAAQEGALRAHHVVRWFLSYGSSGGTISVPYVPYKAGGAGVTREELVAARRAFGELIPRLLSVQVRTFKGAGENKVSSLDVKTLADGLLLAQGCLSSCGWRRPSESLRPPSAPWGGVGEPSIMTACNQNILTL